MAGDHTTPSDPTVLAADLTEESPVRLMPSIALTRLDDLSQAIWQGWSANAVTDDQAQALASLIHDRKRVMRGEVKPIGIPPGRPSIFPPRRLQRAPVRSVALARRRHLAASGPLPS